MAKVKISDGILEGEKVKNEYGGTYYSFKGIPYAKPPLGDLRFKAPQPVEPWDGIRNSSKFGPIAYQNDVYVTKTISGQEDCLYLNVYTPDLVPDNPLAVMVWIHGGGYISGSGNDDIYGPEFLIRKDVVLVTFNYRLGILGFLSLETEDIPGNAGMKDQVAALRWVQNNIKNFGGDPNNVTIFGESAGAASVSYHLISPMSAGLFKRAIIQSGAFTSRWAKCIRPRDRALFLAKKLGCYTEDDKEVAKFLKSQPIESFIDTKLMITAAENFKINIEVYLGIVSEIKFGDTERFFYDDLKLNVHQDVDVVIGYCEHDGTLCLLPGAKTIVDQANMYPEYFVPNPIAYNSTTSEQLDIGKIIKKYYFGDEIISEKNIEKLVNFFTADLFMYSTIVLSRMISACNKNRVYLYKFSCKSKRNLFSKIFDVDHVLEDKTYVCHGDDLAYIFPIKLLPQDVKENTKEYQMIDTVTKLWTNFAKFGCPTPDDSMGVQWLPYTMEKKSYINIGDTIIADNNPEEDEVIFWDKIYARHFPHYVF
ncbi:unnamed protein product [Euphydryas editha]|uniref:Carboxylic ester hydrolase n=1 Tax=Euphydryas editha TaxID=104508 RepID=A0AAU9TBT9_EUPED|nr:unnamed protein product [Euphydryas editha]